MTRLIDDQRFVSKHGYLLPNSWQEQSENGVLFTVQYYYLKSDTRTLNPLDAVRVRTLLYENMRSNDGTFRTLPNDSNPRFSLDNMAAVAGFARRTGFTELLRGLPLFGKYTLRPDNFAYLLYCKFPIVGFCLLPITSIAMIVSCWRAKPDRTSGPLLAYTKARGINMRLTWWLCQKVMPMSMRTAFAIYYPESDHPSNKLVRRIFN